MQQLKKCLGVDIGATSVKVAEVVFDKAGVRATKIARADIGLPPGPMDNERIAVVARTVRDLLKENKITTRAAVFCVPGQSVFIRRIKVPRTTEERLHLIVSYEAKQQIPFALDNAVMEYQVFDSGDGTEVEVLLVAIKRDIVKDFMKVVDKTGLKALMVSVSSLALFNFHILDATPLADLQAELLPSRRKARKAPAASGEGGGGFSLKLPFSFGKKKAAAGTETATVEMATEADALPEYEDVPVDAFEEVRAYVNIGASTFDLTIGRLGTHRLLGFTRSVGWAGNELTRALQEKMGLENPAAAEDMKRGRASIIIPGRESDVLSGGFDADASEFATTWADRLILDLRKSFDYYISQPDGMAVDSILLSGGQAMQPNLPSYIEEKLGIPVEVRTQVQSGDFKVPDMPGEEGVTEYLIALGLALTGVGLGRVTVDFLPSDLKTLREFKKKNIPVAVMLAVVASMVLAGTKVGENRMQAMGNWLSQNQDKIARINADREKLKKAKDEREAANSKLVAIGDALGDRAFWLEFLGVVESAKPADVLITQVKMHPDGQVLIYGEAESVRSITSFNNALKAKKDWVNTLDMSNPNTGFSPFIQKEVQQFSLQMTVHWKETRLAEARATLLPGLTRPTPTPTPPPGSMPGAMPGVMPGGMPGGARF